MLLRVPWLQLFENVHEDFMTSLGTSCLNFQNPTVCNKNLDCFNNLALFKHIFPQRNFWNCIIKPF